jgi:uncharacterized membrane protein required for colicin V production
MNWMDFIPFIIVVIIAVIESNRGFGLALFDLVGGIIIVNIAQWLAGYFAPQISLGGSRQTSEGYLLLIIFLILGVLVLLASKLIYDSTLLSLDALDPIVGGIFGLASGLIVAHVILQALGLIAWQTAFGDSFLNSFAYQQFVEFKGFHILIDKLTHFGDLPTPQP